MISELDSELIKKLADIKVDKVFIGSVYHSMVTDENKSEMINFLTAEKEKGKKLSMSDVYIKELEITKGIKLEDAEQTTY